MQIYSAWCRELLSPSRITISDYMLISHLCIVLERKKFVLLGTE